MIDETEVVPDSKPDEDSMDENEAVGNQEENNNMELDFDRLTPQCSDIHGAHAEAETHGVHSHFLGI